MVVTDFNSMSIEELQVINKELGIGFIVEDGKITGTEKIPATDRKSEQG